MKSTIKILVTLTAVLLVMAGCEYDGPTSQWKLVKEETNSPKITEVVPSVAVPGVNYLTIHGNNFTENQDIVSVYINGYHAEIVDFSDSLIKIRRPDRSGDSLSIKVNVFGAVNLGRWEPYTITSVYEPYGQFLSGIALGSLAIDKDNNIYVVENTSTHEVYKITSSGKKELLGNADALIYSAAVDPNGTLYLFRNQKEIDVLESDTTTVYVTLSERVNTAVFDSQGILYASGKRADLNMVLPDLSIKQAGLYSNDEVFCLRVMDNTLYALIELKYPDESHPAIAIWRHQILDDQGNLSDAELVFDWASAGEAYAESEPVTFTLDPEGGIYIGSDNAAPILYYNPSNGNIDEIYKGIIPSGATKLLWGDGNYLYMVYSDGSSENNLFRIDMGNPQDRDF
ncbi:IPT/TIG domain-containing protein [bacterium]|nr:IPT/TIG domain-containing protein [bacterium]